MKEPKFKLGDEVEIYTQHEVSEGKIVSRTLANDGWRYNVNEVKRKGGWFDLHENQLRKKIEYKLGDRVKVDCEFPFVGTIDLITSENLYFVLKDGCSCDDTPVPFHKKQLRRLVKKKKSYISYDDAVEMIARKYEKYVELKERVQHLEDKFSNDGCELFKLKQKISDDWQNTCMRINKLSIRIEKLENK